jgi:hypothetical protein
MTRVGITGHQNLGGDSRQQHVKQALQHVVSKFPIPLVAVTSLAAGADQVFTRVMLNYGAEIDAVIPFEGYERVFATKSSRDEYVSLLALASTVTVLPRVGSDEECFFEAGKTVVSRSDVLVAIWNGKPARGLGGTADIVKFARDTKHLDIKWINPDADGKIETISARVLP